MLDLKRMQKRVDGEEEAARLANLDCDVGGRVARRGSSRTSPPSSTSPENRSSTPAASSGGSCSRGGEATRSDNSSRTDADVQKLHSPSEIT